MAERFTISIPKPCNESWEKMTPNEKGRFCSSCSKTVIDFTGKNSTEIQQELKARGKEKVCGHFYKKQLDGLVIQIPEETFQKQLSYSKLFLLVLLLTMGTTLISCTSQNGEKQKIENVVVEKRICRGLNVSDTLGLNYNDIPVSGLPVIIDDNYIEGEFVITGDIEKEEIDVNRQIPFAILDTIPRFKGGNYSTREVSKNSFYESISKLVKENFNYNREENKADLHGTQRIYVYFEINKKGLIEKMRTRAPHKLLEEKAMEAVNKLPQFIPGVKNGKEVSVAYTLPIVFKVD